MSSTSTPTQTSDSQIPYILSFYVPIPSTASVCSALTTRTKAGLHPSNLYGETYWSTPGTGNFRPLEGSNAAIGSVGVVEKVEENKVEIMCMGRECVMRAVEVLKEVHPYEVVAYFVTKGEVF